MRNSKEFRYKIMENNEIFTKNGKIYVPKILRAEVLDLYHLFLCHPGITRLQMTISQTMTWEGLAKECKYHVKTCDICQTSKKSTRKYGKLPEKLAEATPWELLCVDLVGPYTVTIDKSTERTLHAMTFIDLATGWFEVCAVPDKKSGTMSQIQ